MATWGDVERLATALPEVAPASSYGSPSWQVKKKTFAWERSLNKSDRKAMGDSAPEGEPFLAIRIPDIGARDAMIAADPDVYFTIPHFGDYPAILVHLDVVTVEQLTEDLTEAWLAMAPPKLAREYLEKQTRAE